MSAFAGRQDRTARSGRSCSANVFEIFFGGARGGGKSDAVLGEWIQHANRYGENAIGLMIRRTRTELVEMVARSRVLYTPLGFVLNETEKTWKSPNGARLRFAYLERDADAELYQGHSYSRIYVEEAGNFPNATPVMKMMATLRSGAGVPVGMRLTGNPGGPGHHWVKRRYIDPFPLGNKVIDDPVTGLDRVYIPSRVENNQFIDVEAYKKRLRASGSADLVRAWLLGDWSVALGAFFDELVDGASCRDTVRDTAGLAAFPLDGLGLGVAVLDRLVGDRAG